MKEPNDSKLFTQSNEGGKEHKKPFPGHLGVFAKDRAVFRSGSRTDRETLRGERIERAGSAHAKTQSTQREQKDFFWRDWHFCASDFLTAAISGRGLLGDFQ